MATNAGLTNRSADDGTLYCGSRSAKYFVAVDWQWIHASGSYFYLLYFDTYDSISMWYNIDDTRAAGQIKRDMMLDSVRLKQGKTHFGRGLTTDPTAHVVTDVDVNLE